MNVVKKQYFYINMAYIVISNTYKTKLNKILCIYTINFINIYIYVTISSISLKVYNSKWGEKQFIIQTDSSYLESKEIG